MEKDLKELTDKLNLKMDEFKSANDALKDALDKKVGEDKITELKGLLDKSNESIEKLNTSIEEMEEKMKKAKTMGLNWNQKLIKEITLESLKGLSEKGADQKQFNIDIHPILALKASDMSEGTNLNFSTYADSVILPIREAGVNKAPDRAPFLVDLFRTATTSGPRITWVERSARTDGTAARLEEGVMGQSDLTWINKSTDVESISTYIKVTNEAMEDWDQIVSEINNELMTLMELKLDAYLLTGTGTSPQIKGITGYADAYTYTGLNGEVAAANIFDAIKAAATQIQVAKFMPNIVCLHPTDIAKMELTKDSSNQYIMPPFLAANGTTVAGLRIIANTGITAGKILAGDFTKGTVYFRKGITIRIWEQNSTDPIYGMKTITADMRAGFKVPSTHTSAFVYDDIADILTAIGK